MCVVGWSEGGGGGGGGEEDTAQAMTLSLTSAFCARKSLFRGKAAVQIIIGLRLRIYKKFSSTSGR